MTNDAEGKKGSNDPYTKWNNYLFVYVISETLIELLHFIKNNCRMEISNFYSLFPNKEEIDEKYQVHPKK